MAINRFSGSFKTRDDVFDNITPNNMVQPKVSHPAGEWKPAAWLPVQWKGEASKDYFVISSGKVVSLDASGRVVPAGLRKKTVAADPIFTYTADDVKAKTEDIRTGEALVSASIGAVTLEEFCTAVLERGWVDEAALSLGHLAFGPTNNAAADNADAQAIIQAFVSHPVGIAAYDVYSWAGDTPDSLKFLNYQKQHLIQFITEAQMKMPQLANGTQVTGIAVPTTAYVAASHGLFPTGTSALTLTLSDLRALERYDRASDEVLFCPPGKAIEAIYLGVKNLVPEVAALTVANQATTLTVSGSDIEGAVVNAKSRIQDIGALGDYFFDAAVGILVVHSLFDAANSYASGDTIATWQYNSAASAAHQHIYFVGNCQPGDHITYDVESNFTKLTVDTSTLPADILGRVLEIQQFPKSLMERVTTAWQGSSFDASMRMPGSATQGLPDNLTLAGQNDEVVGNRMVIANIRIL